MKKKRWRVEPCRSPLRGVIRVSGDAAIAHRALILCSLAQGTSVVDGLPQRPDVMATRRALQALGVAMTEDEQGRLEIEGVGLEGLRPAGGAIACGASGTTLSLLAGVLVGQPFDSVLTGEGAVAGITRPLRNRGGRIDGTVDPVRNEEVPPLYVRGLPRGARLNEIEQRVAVASAEIKGALLLSGFYATGPTVIDEPVVSPDHTERWMEAMGAPIGSMGSIVALDPTGWNGVLRSLEVTIPGDPGLAAFVVVAAHLVPGSRVIVRNVDTNPTRTGAFEVLRDMGGGVVVQSRGVQGGEPVGDLHVGAFGPVELRAPARVGGELALRLRDEIPALVAAAAGSGVRGVSEYRDWVESGLREDSERVRGLVSMLQAFGFEAEVLEDGLRCMGGRRPRGGAVVTSGGDAALAMAATVLALAAEGPTVIEDVACVDEYFADFVTVLSKLGARIDIEEEE